MNTIDKIHQYTHQMRLTGIQKHYKALLDQFKGKTDAYPDFLWQLLEAEYTARSHNAKLSRIRRAKFPYKKTLDQLQIKELPKAAQGKLKELSTLDFIDQGRNIILAGNPGTGKTHLAIALGLKACDQGHKVLFTTIPRLITQIKEYRSDRSLRVLENNFLKYDLIICDEFGYISFDKEGSELLFSHLSLRAGIKSIIITTNLSFDRWNEIFGDAVLTAAMVDRLTHKAYMINMNGDSYRIKETEQWLKK